jgi:hypothetical protein
MPLGNKGGPQVIECVLNRPMSGIYFESYRSELHMDDRLMTIPATRCGCEPDKITSLCLGQHAFEGYRRLDGDTRRRPPDMVSNDFIDRSFARQALNHCDLDSTGDVLLATDNDAETVCIQVQKQPQLETPLLQ